VAGCDGDIQREHRGGGGRNGRPTLHVRFPLIRGPRSNPHQICFVPVEMGGFQHAVAVAQAISGFPIGQRGAQASVAFRRIRVASRRDADGHIGVDVAHQLSR